MGMCTFFVCNNVPIEKQNEKERGYADLKMRRCYIHQSKFYF